GASYESGLFVPAAHSTVQHRNQAVTTFTVTVLDVNDNPPYFPTNPLTVTISEDVQVGSLVTTLNASDPDRPHDLQPIIYSLLSITALPNLHPMTPVNSTQFRLEGHTGRLLLTEPLDRETNLEYQLTVRATDRGSPEAQSCDLALRIQVLDVNDNPPVFGNPSGYRFVIEEEKEPGSVVGVVTATDADEGENGRVSYRLFGTSAAVQRGFVVNPNTGEITTKVVLDREVNAAYEFYVTAEDSSPSKRLTATTKVVVELLDINDNVPKFIYPTQPNHTIHASAYSKVGTAIVKLTVFDADAAGEQGLLFILKNATSPGLFTLNPSSGELSFAREILDEDIGSHYLEIEAKDNGVPPRSSVTSITVVIDTRAHQRAPGATNSGLDYSNRPAYSKAWGSRAEPAYPLYGQEGSGHEVYSRQDGSPPAFDRRLILICCLAFLGCLLLVVFGAILIRFKHRNPLHDNEASTNSVNFVHAKEAKYRAATLQPQTTPVSAFGASGVKDAGRYVYGWSAQRSPLIASTTAAPQHRLLPDQQHQQEQFFRMGFVNNPAAAVTMSSAGNANFERSTRGDSMLQAKNRSSSLGDSLEDYERPPLPMNDRANLYLSQGQVNRAGTVWEPRADRGLNNYEAAGDGSGYYNKLSATSGVILQPGAYMQGGEFFHENCDESNGEPDASVFLRSARPTSTRNAGYQTLSNVSPQSSSDETANFFADAPPGALERADDATRTAPPPPPPQPTTATSASSSLSSWRKNLGKKGIVSSSFV
uniref:PCD15 protein n=1 Tax=Mesocestoides corti TaxID=53468 RepID=A0A5K3FNG0_MESCO